MAALLEKWSAEAGIARRSIGAAEIVERTIGALVGEGRRILEEGIALREVDIDIIYVNGYGFPAWRGGPMFNARAGADGPLPNGRGSAMVSEPRP